MTQPAVLERDLHPVSDKGEQIAADAALAIRATGVAIQCFGFGKGLDQRHPQAVFDHQPNHTQRCAAQGEGILGPRWPLVDPPEADQCIDLVSQRNRDRQRCRGAGVVRAQRRIVLGHRCRNGIAFAVVSRVVGTHDALQLGEFTDHAGGQIGLGQPRGGPCSIPVSAGDVLAEPGGKRAEPVQPVADGPQLGVKNDRRQRRNPAAQTLLAVLIPEEFSIGQARSEHPLVTTCNPLEGLCRTLPVGHRDKVWRERAVCLLQGEILLVLFHRQHQHLLGHCHEPLRNGAADDGRPLDQPRHLGEQARVFDQAAAHGLGRRARAGQNGLGTLLRINHDEACAQRVGEVVRLTERYRAVTGKAVALGLTAKGQADIVAQIQRAGNDPVTEQRGNPVQRAHPAEGSPTPAHGLGPAEIADRGFDQAGQKVDGLLSLHVPDGEIEVALGRFAQLGLIQRLKAVGAEKAGDGLLGRAFARPPAFFGAVGLRDRDPVDPHGEVAGRVPNLCRAGFQPLGFERVGQQAGKVVGRRLLHPRRNFLGKQVDQQAVGRPGSLI